MNASRGKGYLNISRIGLAVPVLLAVLVLSAAAQNTAFQLDPAQTSIKFTLGDVLHTVHGTFRLKHGALQVEPATGKIAGEIVVDAQSGESGSGMRDRKMHKEVLESAHFPEITFRPDRIDGAVASQGKSTIKVHGTFGIHGVEHEIIVPADVEMSGDHWTATVHFTVPYAKWGMKNPSTLFLRVNDSAEIDLVAAGGLVKPTSSISAQ